MINNFAYVTIVTKPKYEACAGRLYQALKYFNSKYPLELLVANDLSEKDLPFLTKNNIPYRKIQPLLFNTEHNRYQHTLTKCISWLLSGYTYLCFIDADIILLENIDFMFDKIDLDKYVNYYKGGELHHTNFCAELFWLKPDINIYNFMINIANKYMDYIYCDEQLFKKCFSFLKSENVIGEGSPLSGLQYIHACGVVKFWEFLEGFDNLKNWFYNDSIEDFYEKLFSGLLKKLLSWIEIYQELMTNIRHYEETLIE